MGKKKTTAAIWTVFLRGSMLSLGIYFAGILLLALLLVKGAIPESGAFPVTAVLCLRHDNLHGEPCRPLYSTPSSLLEF